MVLQIDDMTSDKEVCVVCLSSVEIYSIGECDHPVCFECSTRMRVLCDRNECPICRKEMAKVVFTKHVRPYSSIDTKSMKLERRYAVYFENDDVMKAYDSLLEHVCLVCEDKPTFQDFSTLKDHMRKDHEHYYCELCIEHLKIFTQERRSYTRSQLAQHRRKGDTDDRSHRGHPLCEFCDDRFMDNDELFRHLRRDHYFCHFCDSDGIHQYYDLYNNLREHFRSDHYLCEEGDCAEERFTSVFKTKLDLQAHFATQHSQSLSKQAARQARTVNIEFSVNNEERERGHGGRGGRINRCTEEPGDLSASDKPLEQNAVDINCVHDFPSLGQEMHIDGTSKVKTTQNSTPHLFTIRASRGGRRFTEEDFPSLESTRVIVNTTQAAQPLSTTSAAVHLKVNAKRPSQSNTSKSGGANVSIQYNRVIPGSVFQSNNSKGMDDSKKLMSSGTKKPSVPVNILSSLQVDFPALSVSSTSSTPLWTPSVSVAQPLPTNVPKEMFTKEKIFNPTDFPMLPRSYQGKSSVMIPVSNSWKAESDQSSQEKKKKKKKAATNSVVTNSASNKTLPKKKFSNEENTENHNDTNSYLAKNGDSDSLLPERISNIQVLSADEFEDLRKSELQVGALQAIPKFDLEEFPSLRGSKKYNLNDHISSIPKLPLKSTSSRTLSGIKDAQMIFTSSSGETFDIAPFQKTKPVHTKGKKGSSAYIPPKDFEIRNEKLIKTIRSFFPGNSDKFDHFHNLAKNLRSCKLTAFEYYSSCCQVMGRNIFYKILPELLVLLPDITKQQEILNAYYSDGTKGCSVSFISCEICNQVLNSSDLNSHMDAHNLADFPKLGAVL